MRRPTCLIQRAAWLTVLLLTPALVSAQDDPDAYGDGYRDGTHARVQYLDGGLTVERGSSQSDLPPSEELSINSAVHPGDLVSTDRVQRAEIQLAGGTLVRIGRGSAVNFLSLPAPYADASSPTILQLAEGRLRLDALVDPDGEFRVDTPAATIYLLEDGDYRIDVEPDGMVRLATRRGLAEIVSDGGSTLVRAGMRSSVLPGGLPDRAVAFNTFSGDGFDRWVEDRIAVWRALDRDTGVVPEPVYDDLPVEVRPYYRELSGYGRWTYVSDYGYVWYPVGVAADWRPYYDGYWSYGPGGYFWVGAEPWGWAPYRYGSWNWVSGVGWVWVPGRVFSGAWVAWSWGSVHVGWAPLDFWGRPCWYRSVHYGYYDPYVWTFVDHRYFGHRHYRRYAVPLDGVGDVRTAVVTTRAPRVPPTRFAQPRGDWDRAVKAARDDSRGRLQPIDRQARPTRSRRDVESGVLSRRTARSPEVTGAAERRGRVLSDVRTPSAGDRRATTDRGRVDVPARQRSTGGVVRSVGPSRSPSSRQPQASPTRDRVRDLLRRMSTPRGEPRSSTDRGGASADRGGSTARPQAAPRSSGDRGSRPQAAPRSSGDRGSRPQAAPRSSGNRGSRPQAAPRSSGDRGSSRDSSSGGSGRDSRGNNGGRKGRDR